MQSVPSNSRVLLSRYFDENTYLIAGKCWRCYDEENDVKISGVNQKFLNQAQIFPYSKDISGYNELFFELDDKDFLKGANFNQETKNEREMLEYNLIQNIDEEEVYTSSSETDFFDSLIEVESDAVASPNLISIDNCNNKQIAQNVSFNGEFQRVKDKLTFIGTSSNNVSEEYDFINQKVGLHDSVMDYVGEAIGLPTLTFDDHPHNMQPLNDASLMDEKLIVNENLELPLVEKSKTDFRNIPHNTLMKNEKELCDIANRELKLENSPIDFAGFQKDDFHDHKVINRIAEIISNIETNISATIPIIREPKFERNFDDQNEELKCSDIKQTDLYQSFSGFEQKDVNDNLLVANKMSQLVLKIESNMKKSRKFKKNFNYGNVLFGHKNVLKDENHYLATTSRFFRTKEDRKFISPIVDPQYLPVNTNDLENTVDNRKKSAEFFGFKPEDYENSNALASKMHEVVQTFEHLTKKIYDYEENPCEPKYFANKIIDEIKKENISFDTYPTFSRFFPSQASSCIEPELESQRYCKNEHFPFGENKKLPFDIKAKENLIKNENNDRNYFPTEPIWHPPRSPHNLIEEDLYHDPWALLVATIFLNRTRAKYARDYIEAFLKDYTSPFAVIKAKPPDLERYFENIGLKVVRSIQVWKMSYDFVYKNWRDVKELYGIGRYGSDAFNMFCLGNIDIEPKDRYLRIYKAWYERIHLKKDVNFDRKFLEAKGYKNDEWMSSGGDSDDDYESEIFENGKSTTELESESF
ncbi:hypothetical protein Trydic_g2566 [Trypoxylus dichotomus]